MISVNSNCSRIDAVKASANQLKAQAALTPPSAQKTDSYRKAQSQIQSLDQEIKTGDAQKAETDLSSTASAVKALQIDPDSSTPAQTLLDVYA
jgi:hypothetical protein